MLLFGVGLEVLRNPDGPEAQILCEFCVSDIIVRERTLQNEAELFYLAHKVSRLTPMGE
jgi:hypothetical protein